MRKTAAIALSVACAMPASARAATVKLLPLPEHATIQPFGTRALMAVSSNGTIAATVTIRGYRTQAMLWNANGTRLHVAFAGAVAGFDGSGALLIDADRPRRLVGARAQPVDTSYCEDFPQRSIGPTLAGTLSNGALIATMRSPAMVNLDDASGQNAPVVLYLRSRECLNLGNGVALATAGLYTAGYTAYIENVPAPSNVVSAKERFRAMRWHERTPEPLGDGIAIAINASGAAAGSDVPPGGGAAYAVASHARFWASAGSPIDLAPNSSRSAAYAVDDRDRVISLGTTIWSYCVSVT